MPRFDPISSRTTTNRELLAQLLYFLQVLCGSCLCNIISVITLILVLCHSIENCSIMKGHGGNVIMP